MREPLSRLVSAIALLATLAAAQSPSVADLRKRLRDRDPAQRRAAAVELGARGADALPAAKALVDAFADPDAGVRDAAADALASCGPKAARHVRAALRDRDSQLAAIRAAGGLGEAAVPILPDVTKLWQSEDVALREAIAAALKRLGPLAVPHLAERVSHHLLGIYAAQVLESIGPDARAAVPALIELLSDGVHLGDGDAVEALGAIRDPRAIPLLISLVEKGGVKDVHRDDLAGKAVRSLSEFGAEAAPAVPAIVRFLLDEDLAEELGSPRGRTAYALSVIGVATDEVLAALRSYEDRDDGLGADARSALAVLAPTGAVPVGTLATTIRFHGSVAVRLRSVEELARRSPTPDVVDALAKVAATNSARDVRLAALLGIESLGPAASAARAAVDALTTDADAALADAARRALASLSGERPAA